MTNVRYILLAALATPLGPSTGVEYYNARFCDIVPPYAAAPLADQHDHDHMKRLSG